MWVHLLFHFKIFCNFQTCKTSARKGRILSVILVEWIWRAAGAGGSLQYYYIQRCEALVYPRLALGSSWDEVPPILYAAVSVVLIEMLLLCFWWSICLKFISHKTVTWTSGDLIKDALAVVEWGFEEGKESWIATAATLTFTQHDMCGKSYFSNCCYPYCPKLCVPLLISRYWLLRV